ncbi:MAG: TetR/AcrR family transcriptional regulator [Spirochaetales bacterium]|nr:TetR/AcrR family transcriptional regulator [Spirochaetales bacterium]
MKTRKPKQERGKETRSRFIEAGIRLFSHKGYYYTNAKEIAREANAAVGSFYAYFRDKMDLFLAIMDYHNNAILTAINQEREKLESLKIHDPRTYISHIVKSAIMAHDILPGFHLEVENLETKEKNVRERRNQTIEKSLELIRQIFGKFKDHMNKKDQVLSARIVFHLVDMGGHLHIDGNEDIPSDILVSEMTDIIYKYLFCSDA